jgi:glutamate N-acetyltransferase / amino-acid N-acetyltransferase
MKPKPSRSLHIPAGFLFASTTAGIKASGRSDLAYAEAPNGATAAALFTRNRVVAAPVTVGRAHLATSRGRMHAVVVNSGNANCATGKAGIVACESVCRAVAKELGKKPAQVFPSSTGIIGVTLPVQKIHRALPQLLAARGAGLSDVHRFARAIMTTDTRPKLASASFHFGKRCVSILGMAKGAGMIHPDVATMLVYLFTDVAATPAELHRALHEACASSFNSISIDGDTSTNDTVLLLASEAAGVDLAPSKERFASALAHVCASLAHQIVADGEGVKHVVSIHVEQAKSFDEARRVARAIANSALVKTAWAGSDPNWGRILSAAGSSGAPFDPQRVNIYLGPHQVCRAGAAVKFDQKAAHAYLSRPEFAVRIELRRGHARCTYLTGDLTSAYVHINSAYST